MRPICLACRMFLDSRRQGTRAMLVLTSDDGSNGVSAGTNSIGDSVMSIECELDDRHLA